MTYWYVGSGSNAGNEIAGLTFVYRATKAISAQLGGGYILSQSQSARPYSENGSRFTGLFSVGFYFPL